MILKSETGIRLQRGVGQHMLVFGQHHWVNFGESG